MGRPEAWDEPMSRNIRRAAGTKASEDQFLSLSSDILFLKFFNWRIIALQCCVGFCHTTWISHGHTCIPHPEPSSHLPPHPISQSHPSAPALSTLPHTSNLDWWSASHMIIHTFQRYLLKSSHPRPVPQSPKDCSLHLCRFCCLSYRVIITVFLNSIFVC